MSEFTIKEREHLIQAKNDLYSAIGTLDAAIERLADRARGTYDWDWIKDARITAKKAREAYSKL